jgi:hypothetical protein
LISPLKVATKPALITISLTGCGITTNMMLVASSIAPGDTLLLRTQPAVTKRRRIAHEHAQLLRSRRE